MFASGMLQQGSVGNKRSMGISRFSSSHFLPLGSGSGSRSGSSGLGLSRPAKSGSLSSVSSGSDSLDVAGADPDYIMQLVADVRRFADVLLNLKEAFNAKEHQDCLHQVVHERLGELLRVLKSVIGKHPTLNSVDILSAAGTVIAKVKGVNFTEVNEDHKQELFGEIYTSIDTLAFTFGNVVSDFLMGDVESGSSLGPAQTCRSRSSENLSVESPEKDDPPGPSLPTRVEELDSVLLQSDSGVESALLYAKAWSKYTKELLNWVEKRLSMDMECAKSLSKMAESAKTLASQQEHMPFRDIYISAFNNDIEYSQSLLHTVSALQSNKFMQPLLTRKNELDKLRKEVKEQWQRAQRKMHEAESALKKARLLRDQRQEEYERAHSSASKAEEELLVTGGGKQLEKRRKMEDEALQKAEEAREHYRHCITDVGVKRVDLANAKSEILTQLRTLIFQCDLTLKAVTVNWFQTQQALAASLPVNNQTLCESAKLYEPGQRYTAFVRSLSSDRSRAESFTFNVSAAQTDSPLNKRSVTSAVLSHGNLTQVSPTPGEFLNQDEVDCPVTTRSGKMADRRSHSSTDIQALRIQAPFKSWATGSQGGMCSDSESAGGSSESRSMDSPTASPGDFKRRLPRTPSTGTMSSADDLDEREPPSPSDNGLNEMVTETASSPGPFRNTQMSKAAQTHKLRKLRAPSKCRECDSLVVFHGAECEECSLACHKKCLETLAIQCGHKKLQGKLHLFAVDFAQAARNCPDGIPFIIRKCTSEIENRALNIKGIYRVNGAKSRVEKLCQAFENGKDLVELSDLYPHDISNVLKLYLRQLPEPLILFRYYNDFIGLAKECQSLVVDEVEACRANPTSDPPVVSVELKRILFKIKDLLRQLPAAHYKTLQLLIRHLHRVTEKAEENKMTAINLGIIFGPTLIKPRQAAEAEVSLSSLVDYPYQALIVELLIRHYDMIFDRPLPATSPVSESSPIPTKSRFTPQEKEQQLSRHSRSLVDIKEQHQGAKMYKRHSSVIPSTHLLKEVKEGKVRPEDEEFTAAEEVDSGNVNGVLFSSVPLEKNSPAFGRRNHVSRVQLRPPRPRLGTRPLSLPPERLQNPVDERNARNSADQAGLRGHDPAIEEVSEEEKPKVRSRNHYRSTYIDTNTLRRTWDRQYKHYDASLRSVDSPVDAEAGNANLLSTSAPQDNFLEPGKTTIYTNKTFSVAVTLRPNPSLQKETDVTDHGPVATAFRPPRTLQPPPGTFYKPPGSQAKTPLDTGTKENTAAEDEEEEVDEEEEEYGLEVSVDEPEADSQPTDPPSPPQSPSSSPEEPNLNQSKPVYPRLRARRMQDFENREAHFV